MADAFLKIGDVKGECKDAEYKEWIEVLSWSWGASQLGTAGHGTGLGASKVSLNDFSYTMHFCAASPELARRVDKPTATRAVGAANGRNPLPIVLPCHRVIGADGSLTGFGGGLPTKQYLLTLEGALSNGDLFG